MELPSKSYEFSKADNSFGPRDNRYGLSSGSILAQKTRKLGLMVNTIFVGLCLGFPNKYHVPHLVVRRGSYAQLISECLSLVP